MISGVGGLKQAARGRGEVVSLGSSTCIILKFVVDSFELDCAATKGRIHRTLQITIADPDFRVAVGPRRGFCATAYDV
jgi:hypothetical protein